MKNKISKISVIMSAFNAEKFIAQAIQSTLGQSFSDFEFIIVDDASTDTTPSIIKEFAKKDKRIKTVQNKQNIGLTKSLNIAIKIVKGKYIARQDADDYSAPTRLEKQFNFLEENQKITLIGTSAMIIDDEGNVLCERKVPTNDYEIKTKLQKQNCIFHGSIMFRKQDVQKTGNYRDLFVYGQDYDLYLRLCEHKSISNLQEPLYFWRFSKDSISTKKSVIQKKFGELSRFFSNERKKIGQDSYSEEFIKKYIEKTTPTEKQVLSYEYQKILLLLRAGKFDFKKTIFLKHPTLILRYAYYRLKQLKKGTI